MYIDRILFPIETLGPGNRIVIWTKGCSKHCTNCANPELWSVTGTRNTSPTDVAQIIKNICAENLVDGITFTGGDPLEQMDELLMLLKLIKPMVGDVLLYTGYCYEDFPLLFTSNQTDSLRRLVSVLVDGSYMDHLNDSVVPLRGSTNQNIIFFDKGIEAVYSAYLAKGRKIQNVLMGNKFISVGIHNKRGNDYEK